MSKSSELFDAYKPLRNRLRKVGVSESLYVLWAYMRYFLFNKSLPDDVEADRDFMSDYSRPKTVIYPWEFEALAKEIIINGQLSSPGTDTLRRWKCLSRAINDVRTIDGVISKLYVDHNNVLVEFHRKAHLQFPWQGEFNARYLTRFFKIFNSANIDEITVDVCGLTTNELYIIGMSFLGTYSNYFYVNYPMTITIDDIDIAKVDLFLSRFSKELSDLKPIISDQQEMNDSFFYAYSSLRAFPIIGMRHKEEVRFCCPLPPLLFWRITNGLYYEICNRDNFGMRYGRAFQDYTGEVIEKANDSGALKVISEEQYFDGRNRKDTIDWIVYDKDAALFIECKSKKMVIQAKIALEDQGPLLSELEIMAQSIIQTYKNIKEYINNKYPTFKYDDSIEIYPIIVTLENWYLFGDEILPALRAEVMKKLQEIGIPESYIDDMPYSICSMEEFEEIVQIIQSSGIRSFMRGKIFDSDKRLWAFKQYISDQFPEEKDKLRFLFEDDYENIFKRYLKKGFSA